VKAGDVVKFTAQRDPQVRGHRGVVTDVGKGVVYVDWGNGLRVRKEFAEHVELASEVTL
jgi:hypothetical protein